MRRPRLAITLGDPRGVGPEIVGKALDHPEVQQACDAVIVGPRGASIEVDEAVGSWTPPGDEAAAGRLAGLAIERAATLARQQTVDGIVTAPIDKHALLRGGYSDPGHTEMLARLTSSRTAMMLASERLRVVLATTHIPLRDVPAALSREVILDVARLTSRALREWFDVTAPRIALCALNPHAGDGGRFGDEDDALLTPAAREAGLEGPFPADTVFVRAIHGDFDAVIAPYHDVGMTAIKVASFGQAVNVTLGLPFPRTSPDHGTALDIAGKGVASPTSMVRAILMCARLARKNEERGPRNEEVANSSGPYPR